MDKITIPDLNGTNYFIWELKMKAALSLKRLVPLILEEKPEDLTRKDEMDWITKNSDAIAYIKLSLADEQALQFAAEDNAKCFNDWMCRRGIGHHTVRGLNGKFSKVRDILKTQRGKSMDEILPNFKGRRSNFKLAN
ncbi:retrovirus-related Pol polyprotein from transposon TNT 1-94 [Trichonephila clavipes]|nr:retrovirus-related Pol polyprotein from transposon TNT 1-94 [Trichonephila clavipes]